MRTIKTLLAGLALICSQAFASTMPVTWTDQYDPNPDIYVRGSHVSFSLDITDGAMGYRPGIDHLTGYSVALDLYDDSDDVLRLCLFGRCINSPIPEGETAYIDMPGLLGDRVYLSLGGKEVGGWSAEGWKQLQETGKLAIDIYGAGDFMFGGASLTANGLQVPEPGVLALVGLAILGIGAMRRRRNC